MAEGAERDARECAVQLALAPSLQAARGYAHEETGRAWERAGALAESCGDEESVTMTLLQRSLTSLTRGDLVRADEMLAQGIEIARGRRHDEHMLVGYTNLAVSKTYQGKFVEARTLCEQIVALYDVARHSYVALK